MRRGKRNRIIGLLILTILLAGCLLAGCGAMQDGTGEGKTGQESEGLETGGESRLPETGEDQDSSESAAAEEEENGGSSKAEPEPSFGASAGVPSICVDQSGYITKGDKIAIFYGRELPREFHVVKEETGEVVFAGYLKSDGYNGGGQEYNGYGDFSEVQESGTYYIEAPLLGRSYSFRVGDDLYEEVFGEVCRQYFEGRQEKEEPGGSVEEAAREITVMLLAYELNPGVFTDDTGIPESGNGIPDLLDEIRHEIEWMLEGGEAEAEAEEAFAMVLAKFSYFYQEYDTEFATECLKAADIAWMQADLTEADHGDSAEDGKHEWKFAAAAELYRASGKQSYHRYVTEYLSGEIEWKEMDLPLLAGGAAYICTRQPVDLPLCEEITRALTIRAEEAAQNVEDILWNRQEETSEGGRELLEESIYLILINHMITSKEYAAMIENCFHYLMGRNVQSICYIENAGENNYRMEEETAGVSSWPEGNGRLILLLGDILNWQAEHGS